MDENKINELIDELITIGCRPDDAIERFMDDTEIFVDYVLQFPDEASMPTLVKAMDAKDYIAAEKAVHAMKGLTKNLSFTRLADAATDMVAELNDDNISDALEAYDSVKKEYAILCDVINKYKNA